MWYPKEDVYSKPVDDSVQEPSQEVAKTHLWLICSAQDNNMMMTYTQTHMLSLMKRYLQIYGQRHQLVHTKANLVASH